MSRSYRKHHYSKSGSPEYRRKAKKWANDNVKNFEGPIPKGKWFRKLFPQYDMYEDITYVSWEEYNTWYCIDEKWVWNKSRIVTIIKLTKDQIRAEWLKKYHYK